MRTQPEDRYGPRMAKKVLSVIDAAPPTAFDIFTVTGAVIIRLCALCTDAVLSGAVPTIEVGVAGDIACIIPQIVNATDLIAGEWWYDATPTTTVDDESAVILEKVISGGQDVILTTGGAAITAGEIEFTAWFRPISWDGDVQAA